MVFETMPIEIVVAAAILALSLTILFIYHKLDDRRRWERLMAHADKDYDDELE